MLTLRLAHALRLHLTHTRRNKFLTHHFVHQLKLAGAVPIIHSHDFDRASPIYDVHAFKNFLTKIFSPAHCDSHVAALVAILASPVIILQRSVRSRTHTTLRVKLSDSRTRCVCISHSRRNKFLTHHFVHQLKLADAVPITHSHDSDRASPIYDSHALQKFSVGNFCNACES